MLEHLDISLIFRVKFESLGDIGGIGSDGTIVTVFKSHGKILDISDVSVLVFELLHVVIVTGGEYRGDCQC